MGNCGSGPLPNIQYLTPPVVVNNGIMSQIGLEAQTNNVFWCLTDTKTGWLVKAYSVSKLEYFSNGVILWFEKYKLYNRLERLESGNILFTSSDGGTYITERNGEPFELKGIEEFDKLLRLFPFRPGKPSTQ